MWAGGYHKRKAMWIVHRIPKQSLTILVMNIATTTLNQAHGFSFDLWFN